MRRVSSGVSIVSPGSLTGINCPLTSTCGKLPGERIKSLTRGETRSMASSNPCVGITCLTAGGTAAETGLAATGLTGSKIRSFVPVVSLCSLSTRSQVTSVATFDRVFGSLFSRATTCLPAHFVDRSAAAGSSALNALVNRGNLDSDRRARPRPARVLSGRHHAKT